LSNQKYKKWQTNTGGKGRFTIAIKDILNNNEGIENAAVVDILNL
jgi:arginine decarboxylase-like protein